MRVPAVPNYSRKAVGHIKMIIYKLIIIICVILFIIYRKLKKTYTYWKRKGVNGPKPLWLFGNILPLLRKKETLNSLMKKICKIYPNEQAVGMYFGVAPTLVLKDPAIIKKVLIQDFTSFADRGIKLTEEKLLNSILFEKGEKWKIYRQKISPLFSTRSINNIFLPKIVELTDLFLNYIEDLPHGPKELRLLDHKLSVGLAMSFIGLTVDTLNDKVDSGSIGDELLQFPARLTLGAILYGFSPKLPTAIGFKVVPENFVDKIINESKDALKDNMQEYRNVFDFMVKLKEEGVVKKLRKDGIVEIEISEAIFASHIALFFGAGLEVYANSSFLLFEIALNQDIQERCYKEIEQIMKKYNGDLTLETMHELQYVNMAFDESLRKYPSGDALIRVSTKDYHFEDIDLNIEKGTTIIIPVQAIHHDQSYFPNPEVFDPERFSPENKKMMQDCTYLPFGDGPKKCIGYRLARLQNIMLIAKFLHRFKVTPCEKTVSKARIIPLRLSLYAQDGLWVNITRRQK